NSNLGHLHLSAGRVDEAMRAFEAALEAGKLLPGPSMEDGSFAAVFRGIGKVHRHRHEYAKALEALKRAIEIGETNPGEKPFSLYELACARALLSAVLEESKSEGGGDSATQRRYTDQALDALGQAVDGGWYNAALTRRDPDLEILRPREAFQKLLKEMDEK